MKALLTAMAILLAGCTDESKGQVHPNACGTSCFISSQCDRVFSGCGECLFGQCTAVLPAQPTNDAGVDAPARTK